MTRTTCLVCFISTVNDHCNKKRKEKKKLTRGRLALVASTQQTLINLFWIWFIQAAYFVSTLSYSGKMFMNFATGVKFK